jgi:phytol kinase
VPNPRYILFFALVLALGEIARRRVRLPPDLTRKGVLGAIALGAVAAIARSSEPRAVSMAFFILAFVLYLSFRFEILAAIEDEGPTPGSVLAPLSLALLLSLVASEEPHLAAASALAMVGDWAAALIGRRRATRRFHLLGHPRSMEGTLTLFLVASAAMTPALAKLGGLDWHPAAAFALIAGTVAASVETLSPHGSDNATVPFSVLLTLALLTEASGQ